MKRILVPCDFSAPAVEAYQFATEIAAASDGEVFALKAIDLPIMLAGGFDVQPYVFDPSIFKQLEDEAHRNYVGMKKKHGHWSGRESFHVHHGSVITIIREFIKDHKIDMVVMGTHGSSGLSEYFVGSNTEKIVRLSPVPVFSVSKAPKVASIKKIVFPTSLELNQTELILKIKSLQEFLGAALHLLWVNTPAFFKRNHEIELMLEEFAKHYHLKNFDLNIRNDIAEQEGILSFAREIKADAIAMSTHGRRGLIHLLTGSMAEDVVNHLPCPVWTYSTHKK